MERNHVAALKRAIEITGGSQAAFAERLRAALTASGSHLKASQQLVSYWIRKGVRLGPEWWPVIESVTNFEVTRRDLRPDVFTDPPPAGARDRPGVF